MGFETNRPDMTEADIVKGAERVLPPSALTRGHVCNLLMALSTGILPVWGDSLLSNNSNNNNKTSTGATAAVVKEVGPISVIHASTCLVLSFALSPWMMEPDRPAFSVERRVQGYE